MAESATETARLRVFVDADVLIAGAAGPSEHGASLVVLRLAEITLIEAVACQQVIAEAERDIEAKLPGALPAFRLLVARCLRIVGDPGPDVLDAFKDQADQKDLPILVAALQAECGFLVTFNTRHYRPTGDSILVVRPGDLVARVRDRLAAFGSTGAGAWRGTAGER